MQELRWQRDHPRPHRVWTIFDQQNDVVAMRRYLVNHKVMGLGVCWCGWDGDTVRGQYPR